MVKRPLVSGEMQREKQASQTRVVDLRKVASSPVYLSPHPPRNGVQKGQNVGALVPQFSQQVGRSYREHLACSLRAVAAGQAEAEMFVVVCTVYAEDHA